ncbi:MAG: glycosyltransferase family 39 protein [Patescibacteria group bacterium]
MNFELIFIPLIFIFSFVGLLVDKKKSLYVLLAVSVLLHKELFSIYSWNILPARIFMLAVLVFVIVDIAKSFKKKDTDWIKKDFINPVTLSLMAFWIIAGLSIFFSKNVKASLSVYAFLTSVTALSIYLIRVFQGDRAQVLRFTKFYILVAFVLSLIGFVQIFVFTKYHFIFGAFWNVPGHTPRIGSLFWDVNHFAGFLVLLLPVIGALVLVSRSRERLIFFVMGLSILITLLLTNARSGWIACAVAFLTFALLLIFRRFRYKGLATIFSVILILSIGIFSQYLKKDSPIRREIRQYFHYRLDSFDSHFLLLTGSWQIFEKYPILGGGYGSFYEQFSKTKISATFFSRDPAALNTRVPAHSIWGELLAETGVLGFSAMLIFYSSVVFTLLYASLRLKNPQDSLICSAMSGSVIGILVAGIFYSYNSEFFWIILFFYFLYALFSLRDELKESTSRLWTNVFSHFISNPKFPVMVLLILSSILIFVDLGKNHLIPYDEAIYAKVSKNILERNDWLTLSWQNNEPWFEKPPLYFWLSALLLKVLPIPELTVRLPSAVFGLFTVILTFFFAKRLFGKPAGFIAGLSLLTTFQFLYYSRTGMLDVTCAFFVTASLYAYYVSLSKAGFKKVRPLFFLMLSGTFIGLAVLTKGVVGFLPLMIIGIFETVSFLSSLRSRQGGRSNLRSLIVSSLARIFVIAIVSALIFLPWHFSMYQLHGQNFINSYLGYHVLERVTMEVEDKVAPFYWYAVVLKVSMRLWFVALLPSLLFAIYSLIRNHGDRRKLAFILVWAIIILTVFSVSKSKLVWYIIPIYPALSIIIGYFYSSLLNFVDMKISRFKYISSFVLKSTIIYTTICVSLLYLLMNKELVYTSDLTGSQATLLKLKDTTYGTSAKVYADRIDLPLMLFYTNGPFEVTDFTPLTESIKSANQEGVRLIFITKESRFKKLQNGFPAVKLVSFSNEWYLGELVGR